MCAQELRVGPWCRPELRVSPPWGLAQGFAWGWLSTSFVGWNEVHHCSALLSCLHGLKPPPQMDLGSSCSHLLHGVSVHVGCTAEGLPSLRPTTVQGPACTAESCPGPASLSRPPHSTSQPHVPCARGSLRGRAVSELNGDFLGPTWCQYQAKCRSHSHDQESPGP